MKKENALVQISVPVSAGELFDKKTILEIKRDRFVDPGQRANVVHELGLLTEITKKILDDTTEASEVGRQEADLKRINLQLWDLENLVRAYERRNMFDDDFVNAARSIYAGNDQRAAVKRQINKMLMSSVIEEKSHT